MKIRTDFVTNSSSSSFILGFKSKDNIQEELLKNCSSCLIKEYVVKDANKAETFDSKEVIKRIKENLKYEARYHIEYQYERTGHTFTEAIEYMKTAEAEKAVKDYIQSMIDKVKVKIKENEYSTFIELEYSDNDGIDFSLLEHKIMPYFEQTVVSFNHH